MRLARIATLTAAGLLGWLAACTGGLAADASAPQGYLRYPAICHDRIAFTCENNIWWVPREGGDAHRLTDAPGVQAQAHWSPDGKLLAYTSTQDGNAEVYVIGRDGGVPRRLTTHPSTDQCIGWTPDGKVLFRSRRLGAHYDYHVFSVSPEGGEPSELPVDMAALLSVAPDGDTVAFNRWALEGRTWKRYLGGWAEDVWYGSLKAHDFRRLTHYPGNDLFPMFWQDRVVFLSDRDGTGNLWAVRPDGRDLAQVTHQSGFDVRQPDIFGDSVVYTVGADVWMTNLSMGQSVRVPINVPTDLHERVTSGVDPKEYLASFTLSRDGRRLALGSRGEIATLPLKEGRTVSLTRNDSTANQRDAAWSPDGKRVAFVSDAGGEESLWTAPDDGAEAPKQLTKPGTARLFPPIWSPDGKRLAFATSDMQVLVADASSGAVTKAVESTAGEITQYAWSPDSRYLAVTVPLDSDFQQIRIWDSHDGKVHDATSSWYSSYGACWDPKGRWLYLLSDRTFNPLIGNVDFTTILDKMTRPYALVLAAGKPDPFFPKPETDEDKDKEKDGKDASGKGGGGKAKGDEKKDDKKKEEPKPVVIDWDGLQDRLAPFPVEAGHLDALAATDDHVLWLEMPTMGLMDGADELGESMEPRATLQAFDLDKKEAKPLAHAVAGFEVTPDGKRLVLRDKEGFAWRDGLGSAEGGKGDDGDKRVDLSQWNLRVDRPVEWGQIFQECWRLQREFFWDASMNHADWSALRDKYGSLLPRLTTRDELNDLMGQLIGELSNSHTYVWAPGDVAKAPQQGIGLLGARLEPDSKCDCHRFAEVYDGADWEERSRSPVTLPQAGVKQGDYLFAINGRTLGAKDDVETALVGLDRKLVTLRVGRTADAKAARDVEVMTVGDDSRLRNIQWVRDRRAAADKLSGGKIGYVYLPDMGGEGLTEFSSSFYQQLDKDALILDARWNGGGFVSQLIIERLRRLLWAWDRPRRGAAHTAPYRVFTGPMAVLSNGSTGSDGDIFCATFQTLGLGPVIGTRTWGGVIGIRGDKPFVDGGMTTQPEFASWFLKRGWGVENDGVHPDIEVENDPGLVVTGHDPQLEKAVSVLLESLKGRTPARPAFEPAPDKSKQAFSKAQEEWLHEP